MAFQLMSQSVTVSVYF